MKLLSRLLRPEAALFRCIVFSCSTRQTIRRIGARQVSVAFDVPRAHVNDDWLTRKVYVPAQGASAYRGNARLTPAVTRRGEPQAIDSSI